MSDENSGKEKYVPPANTAQMPEWVTASGDTKLVLGKQIGHGGIVNVFETELDVGGKNYLDLVAKIQWHGLEDGDANAEEQRNIDMLNKSFQERYPDLPSPFPNSRLIPATNGSVLVQELVPKEDNLFTKESEKYFKENPRMMCKAFIQFLQLANVGESLGLEMIDRKGADFFFVPESQRLVILDWNVMGKAFPRFDPEKACLNPGVKIFCDDRLQFWPESVQPQIMALKNVLYSHDDHTTSTEVIGVIEEIEKSFSDSTGFEINKVNAFIDSRRQTIEAAAAERKTPSYQFKKVWCEFDARQGSPDFDIEVSKLCGDNSESPNVAALQFYKDFSISIVFADLYGEPAGTIAKEMRKTYTKDWRREFTSDMAELLASGEQTGETIQSRLKTKVGQILSDPKIKEFYFDVDKTPFPDSVKRLLSMD